MKKMIVFVFLVILSGQCFCINLSCPSLPVEVNLGKESLGGWIGGHEWNKKNLNTNKNTTYISKKWDTTFIQNFKDKEYSIIGCCVIKKSVGLICLNKRLDKLSCKPSNKRISNFGFQCK